MPPTSNPLRAAKRAKRLLDAQHDAYRESLTRAYLAGHSYAEIADAVGVSRQAVRQLLTR